MNRDKLNSIVFIKNGRVISSPLITVREYGRWLESVFDEYTCHYELYLKSIVDGERVLEFHPGTRIGKYFDSTVFTSPKYNSWYIYSDSDIMEKLVRMKMAEYNDVASTSSGDRKGLRLLRLYSADQIELYVRTKLDKSFTIQSKLMVPKKIIIKQPDVDQIIMPRVEEVGRRSLF